MSWNVEAAKTTRPLARVFDKFGDIICQHYDSQLLTTNMKGNSASSPVVWRRPKAPEDETDRNNLNGILCYSPDDEPSERLLACRALVSRLEQALREAKLLHLQCGEVLLPQDLTWRIADQVLTNSDYEPCGLRGCVIYIHLQDKNKPHSAEEPKRVGVVRCDPDTVATFEIHLTLFQDTSSWFRHLVPNKLLQTLGKQTSLVVSSRFNLHKKKLYRSGSQ